MATTENLFTGDGSTTNYSFTFEYIEQSDVKADIAGSTTTDFTFANATTLSFNTAPANGAEIRIYRDTDLDTLKATFFAGSAIKAEDLNNNFTQNNFAVQEIKNNTWDSDLQTIKSNETWVSNDDQIATTAAMDARFWDQDTDTLDSTETWQDSDSYIPTAGAVDSAIDEAITNDISTDGTGITVTDDGDGTITLGLADNAVDFSKIKDVDIITYAEQNAGSPSWDSDSRLATTYASSKRFDTLVQTTVPSGSDWQVGKTWLQNDQDLTLSVWNGINWLAIASGGAFINQPKVVYVDATSGADTNDGHRISRPKKTIKAAVNQINSDSIYGNGSVVVVAPGTYQEVAPIDITKKDVGIIGTALRSCVVHPTPATEENSLFRVNSGTFLQNLTFTGVKASGARGGNSLDTDSTYGLPTNQGWNVSFYPGATIVKSPYIQNCTNFSDSEINNSSLDPHNPAGGAGGDTDSQTTGGGLLIDGSVVDSNSPLRSMVCDSYTHVGLDGPGIFVTNNGYAQCTSSYAFFNHYHIKCLNGGQANLAASTTDFGRYGLIADGKSPTAIFTATTTVNAADEDIFFTIGTPSAGSGWHGSATRPQSNMLVEIGGNIYPILSASANGAGWDVTISRPDPTDRANNLGLDGAVSSGSAVSFYLRSMIASSGHTMEYVGSGTNYSALPENGGVPIEANQVVELNNGKVWTATTDHNGKFKVGDFFTVDQQNSSISVASGSFQVNLGTLAVDGTGNAVIGAPLDLSGNSISDSTGSVTINDTLDVNGNKIVNVTDPTLAQDAATKNYVDSTFVELTGDTMTGALALPSGTAGAPSLSVSTTNNGLYSPGANQVAISTNGTGRLFVDSSGKVGVGTTSPASLLSVEKGNVQNRGQWSDCAVALHNPTNTGSYSQIGFGYAPSQTYASAYLGFISTSQATSGKGDIVIGTRDVVTDTQPSEKLRLTSDGKLGLGTSTPATALDIAGSSPAIQFTDTTVATTERNWRIIVSDLVEGDFNIKQEDGNDTNTYQSRFYINSSGNVGIGTASPTKALEVAAGSTASNGLLVTGSSSPQIRLEEATGVTGSLQADSTAIYVGTVSNHPLILRTNVDERARIDSSGRLLVGTSSARTNFDSAFGGYASIAQIETATAGPTGLSIYNNNSSGYFPRIVLGISGGSSIGSNTLVASGNTLGVLSFQGSDGSKPVEAASIKAFVNGPPGANDMPGGLVFSTTADGASSPTERMRVDSAGTVLIGATSSPGAGTSTTGVGFGTGGSISVHRSAATPCFFGRSDDGEVIALYSGTTQRGTVSISGATTTYGSVSDYRLKENIAPISGAASKVSQLKPSKFNFIEVPEQTVDGFIAHEVQEVVPEAVIGSKDAIDEDGKPIYQSIDQSKLVPLLTAALQEALAKIETLEQRLNDAGIA